MYHHEDLNKNFLFDFDYFCHWNDKSRHQGTHNCCNFYLSLTAAMVNIRFSTTAMPKFQICFCANVWIIWKNLIWWKNLNHLKIVLLGSMEEHQHTNGAKNKSGKVTRFCRNMKKDDDKLIVIFSRRVSQRLAPFVPDSPVVSPRTC